MPMHPPSLHSHTRMHLLRKRQSYTTWQLSVDGVALIGVVKAGETIFWCQFLDFGGHRNKLETKHGHATTLRTLSSHTEPLLVAYLSNNKQKKRIFDETGNGDAALRLNTSFVTCMACSLYFLV